MPQLLKNVVTTAPAQSETPAAFGEILAGAFRAVGRRIGPVVTVQLFNRIAAANESDEIDELSGFDLLISKLRYLNSKYFVFDISQVTEIDHAALQHFLGAKSILENGGGRVVLTGLPSSDDTLLSELLTRFAHFSNPEDALHYLESDGYPLTNPDMESNSLEAVRPRNIGLGSENSSSIASANSNGENGDDLFAYYSLAGC